MEKLISFWQNNKKVLTIVASVVLSLLFIGSIILAVFIGGEFKHEEVVQTVKGRITIKEAVYKTRYLSGESFSFDKENAVIQLIAKDPDTAKTVKEDKLEDSEYGFLVNGEGDMHSDPSEIIMTEEMTVISVASARYPTLKFDIPVKVLNKDSISYSAGLTLEAEEANFYLDGKLLSDEEKAVTPNAEKPFLSSAGSEANIISGSNIDCSGDACLRNLGVSDVHIDFEVVCSEEAEVDLQIMICKRTEAKNFGGSFILYLNGERITAADNISVPARVQNSETNYFTSYTMSAIKIKLEAGVNVISFENAKNNPGNLDAIMLTAQSAIIGAFAS